MALKKKNLDVKIVLPDGITASMEKTILKIKGPKGENKRNIFNPALETSISSNTIISKPKRVSKREKKLLGTLEAHIKNMIKGVREGYVYKLKICSGHFPMTVSVSGKELTIKNFFGERIPRVLKLKEGAIVKVDGAFITVESCDKEIAGQVAADIETLTKRPGFDKRIFQDGCYIIDKSGKLM